MYDRWYATALQKKLARPYVHLIFGARQTGKSTLIERLLHESEVVRIDFTRSEERSRFLVDPDELIRLCRGLPRRRQAPCIQIHPFHCHGLAGLHRTSYSPPPTSKHV